MQQPEKALFCCYTFFNTFLAVEGLKHAVSRASVPETQVAPSCDIVSIVLQYYNGLVALGFAGT